MQKLKHARQLLLCYTQRSVSSRVFFVVLNSLISTPVYFYTHVRERLHARSLTALSVLAVLVVLAGTGINLLHPVTANAATNSSTISFQARLENSTGSIVPDGNYNIEYKLYNALTSSGSSQGSCTGDSACLWTEDYLNSASHGVSVVDGYLSVNLGSITSFPSTINWNQPVYLTMNIGGTSTGTPTWDGEMTPRLQLTAVPDAFQAQALQSTIGSYTSSLTFPTSFTGNDAITLPDATGTVCLDSSLSCGFALSTGSGGYIQNTTTSKAENFNIQAATGGTVAGVLEAASTGTADILDLQNSSAVNVFSVGYTGRTLIKPSTTSATAFQVQDASSVDALDVDTANDRVGIGTAAPAYPLDVVGSINTSTSYLIGGNIVVQAPGTNNILVGGAGNATMTGNSDVAVGANALHANTSGSSDVAVGYGSLQANTSGIDDAALGYESLYTNNGGNYNTSVGYQSLLNNTTGSGNTVQGYKAGYTSVGANANNTGSNNTFIGYEAGPGSTTQLQNATSIGTYSVVSQNDSLVLGCISGVNGCTTSTSVGIGTSTPVANFDAVGTSVFESATNSTNSFQIQNSSAAPLFTADTTNMRVIIGSGGTATGQLYVAGSGGTLLSSTLAGTSGDEDTDEVISGHYLYINEYTLSKLAVYDISNPTSPVLIGTPITVGANPVGMALSGHYLYIDNWGAPSMQVVDISDPTAPTVVSTTTTDTHPAELTVVGRYAYLATVNGVDVMDISNPANPVKLTVISTTAAPQHIISSGRYVYIAEASNGTHAYAQAIDTTNNTVVGTYTLAGGSAANTQTASATYGVNEMAIDGRYLYVTNEGNKTIDAFDISNPAATLSAPTSTVSTGASLMPFSLYAQGRYLYASLSTNYATPASLATYDISNISSITQVSSTTSTYVPESLLVQGRYAYETGSTGYLQSFDLGGEYAQQLETGGLETGTLAVDSDANFNGNASIAGGVQIGQSLQVSGNLGVSGSVDFQNATNSTTALQVQNAAGAQVLTVNTTSSLVSVQGTNSDAVLSAEKMLSNTNFSSNWTGTGWTFSSSSATHTSGTTPAVYAGFTPVAGTTYQITYTFASAPGNGVATITPNIGGVSGTPIYPAATTDTQVITASTTGGLEFIPTTGWTGVISSVSVMAITQSNTIFQALNSAGTNGLQIRVSSADPIDEFIGYQAGANNTTGNWDTAMGYSSLSNNTTGYGNAAFGDFALQENTTANLNAAFGDSSLEYNTTGYSNSGIGEGTLMHNTTGYANTAVGQGALISNTSGFTNSALGYAALSSNTTGVASTAVGSYSLQNDIGTDNTAVGSFSLQGSTTASYDVAVGETSLYSENGAGNVGIGFRAGQGNASTYDTTGTDNTYIGFETGPATGTAMQNATAIGTYATVGESNALVLGCVSGSNGCTTSTSVGIGTATPSATLNVVGSTLLMANGITVDDLVVKDTLGQNLLQVGTNIGSAYLQVGGTGETNSYIDLYQGSTDEFEVGAQNATLGQQAFTISNNTATNGLTLNYSNEATTLQNSVDGTTAFQVQDAAGNSIFTTDTTNAANISSGNLYVTSGAATSCSYSNFTSTVSGLSPSAYWKLEDTGGSTADSSGNSDTGTNTNVTQNVTPGPFGCYTSAHAVSLAGTGSIVTANNYTAPGPTNFTIMTMFKTTGSGPLITYSNSSTANDRTMYVGTNGELYSDQYYLLTSHYIHSPTVVNDGNWHMAVATFSTTAGMALYLDGQLVGTNANTGQASVTGGHWELGATSGSTLLNEIASYTGTMGETAYIPSVISATNVTKLASYAGLGTAALGIGTTAPAANLNVVGTTLLQAASQAAFQVQDGSGNPLLLADTTDELVAVGGTLSVTPSTASATDFQVFAGAGALTPYLTVDSLTHFNVQIGSSTGSNNNIEFGLNNYNNSTTDYSGGVDGEMYYNGLTHSFRCHENSAWQSCGPQQGIVASDVSNATTTAANITGLTFGVTASTNYSLSCNLYYTSTSGAYPKFGLNGPASPTAVTGLIEQTNTTTASASSVNVIALNAYGVVAPYTTTVGANATSYPVHLEATFRNGTTAGTLALQMASSTTTAVLAKAGSSCLLTQL
jgi:hypothetical protein